MFSQSDLDQLLSAMRANGITRLDVRDRDKHLRLDLPPGAAPAAPPTAAIDNAPRTLAVHSPCIGRFLPRGGDDGLPLLEPDAEVTADEVLGYVGDGEARAILAAPAGGRLWGVAPAPGTVLGHGDTVFTMEPSS